MSNNWMRPFLQTIAFAVILLTSAGIVQHKATVRKAEALRQLRTELRSLQLRERLRAWSRPGLAGRQAAWNSAKAEFILHKYGAGIQHGTLALDESQALVDAVHRLLGGETQSRLGMPRMMEEPGAKLRAYFSEIDQTLQTYSITVPSVYDPTVAWPLIVSLHGHGWFRPFQGHPAPSYTGAFGLAPQGRGATDYKELGELDVLRAIAEVKLDYNIDADRIVLLGSSMGGTGSWQLGAHYPDLFSAIVPMAGNADYRAWTLRWGWNQWFPGRWNSLRRWLQESHSARAYSRNFSNLPVFAVHGSGDTVVPPEHSRAMVDAIRSFGGPVEYREAPAAGHGVPGHLAQEGIAWALGWSRKAYPGKVHIKTDLMRHGRAYWLEIVQKTQPCDFATVEAEVLQPNAVAIQTENVKTLRLERACQLFEPRLPLTISIDNSRIYLEPTSEDTMHVTLVKEENGWRRAEINEPRHGLRKIREIEGPISEALRAPFVLVLGTAAESEKIKALWAAEVRRFAEEWKRRNGGWCRIIEDTALTPQIAAGRNLILFGGPRHNSVAAELADELPLDDVLNLAALYMPDDRSPVGLAAFTDPDIGLFMLHPNPRHPDRLIAMLAGAGPEAIYQAWQRFGNWFNWGVFDSKKYFDCAVYDARTASPETFLLLGYFGTDWSVRNGEWFGGEGDLRQQFAAQLFPAIEADKLPRRYDVHKLVHVRPSAINQMRGAVGFGRSFYGQPLTASLGIRAPSILEYDLNGFTGRFTAGMQLIPAPHSALSSSQWEQEKVRFIVLADGKVLKSREVNWRDEPHQIDIRLDNIQKLTLQAVIAGGPGWRHASAAWIQPKLIREQP